jgi:hypothetical protein
MKTKSRRDIVLEETVDDELDYAMGLCKPHKIAEDDILKPLIYGDRAALRPLAIKLLQKLRQQRGAKKRREQQQVGFGKYLSPTAVAYLAWRMVHQCSIEGWPPPPQLTKLLEVLLYADTFTVPKGDSYIKTRVLLYCARHPHASARKVAEAFKAFDLSKTTVAGWKKEPEFQRQREAALKRELDAKINTRQ